MSASPSSERLGSLPGHLHGFALMHTGMRRDARRLTAAAPALTAAGTEAAARWWSRLRDVIDWHHRSEDHTLWPELLRKLPDCAEQAKKLADDHGELDAAMDGVSAALRPGSPAGGELTTAARRFSEVLHEHLADEEEIVFPVFLRLGERDYLDLEQRLVRTAPPRTLAYLPPWMFDEAPADSVRRVAATMPPPVRVLGRTVLRRRYERGLGAVLRPR
ncbi:hypothetical protein C6N75_09495 [Streptomyces solincola]|uniref:Hemerythrin-like domain-containing protein n=1 Tax=Streptomyces solincola TaxID=2100817 RepID=A0A2S9PYM5_9ACTN|nr:hemerythrin domain-containing protein [Streptomyces solincola]PRH79453.1 hypothetical protein C6N75_09495 [Streptomyces solincola]